MKKKLTHKDHLEAHKKLMETQQFGLTKEDYQLIENLYNVDMDKLVKTFKRQYLGTWLPQPTQEDINLAKEQAFNYYLNKGKVKPEQYFLDKIMKKQKFNVKCGFKPKKD